MSRLNKFLMLKVFDGDLQFVLDGKFPETFREMVTVGDMEDYHMSTEVPNEER